MKSKILKIENCNTCEEVTLLLSRRSDEENFIEISAWHKKEDVDFFQVEEIHSDDIKLLEGIINDFSIDSAESFARNFN